MGAERTPNTLGSGDASGPDESTAVVGPHVSSPRLRDPPLDARIGRYVVLEEIGRGGMGRVLRAYDPKLQREVALKVVRRRALGRDARARLVAEARAMATLSHANVVAVYDVEDGGEVVVVMEYVAGQTLQTWMTSQRRRWSEVVDLFVAAGRGLAAAHAVGLMHRDFKPTNVLVSTEGVAKVTDFGLAKRGASTNGSGTSDGPDSTGSHRRASPDSEDLTEAGTVMGTPKYMAPEQHEGRPLTPAADQYAFCVALWEGLCGEAPFAADNGGVLRLGQLKLAGPPAWPSNAATAPPRAIVDAIVRGLSPNPAKRWPDMNALLDALSYDPARRRTRWLLALTGVGVLAGGAALWQASDARATQQCSGAEAALVDVWDESRRDRVHAAITGIDKPYAPEVWERAAKRLDDYAAGWVRMHTEACEATTVRGEQSSAVMDLQMACLHRAKVELQAVTAVLADANAEVLDRADRVLGALRPLSRCADIEALQAEVEPPLPGEADAVEDARGHLATAKAVLAAGRYEQARDEIEAAKSSLEGVEYGPVRTEVALAEGRVLDVMGQYAAAETAYEDALERAVRLEQRRQMGEAAARLLFVVGYRQQKFDEGLRYRAIAQGVAAGDPITEASMANAIGSILDSQGKLEEAEVELRRAVTLREQALGPDDPLVGESHNNLAIALVRQGKYEKAEAEFREGLAIREKALGPRHPRVAESINNIAVVLVERGRYGEAEAEHRKALALRQEALGPDHPIVGESINNLGVVFQAQGRYSEAEAEYRRALPLFEKAFGPEHPRVAEARLNIANMLGLQGRYEAAETEHRRALGVFVKVFGPEHPRVAESHDNLGVILGEQGRYEEAETELRTALEMRETLLGPEHPHVAASRTNLAAVLLDRGEVESARKLAQQAWDSSQQTDVGPAPRARTAHVLARCLWATEDPADQTRARTLAQQALETLVDAELDQVQEAQDLRAWLSQHS